MWTACSFDPMAHLKVSKGERRKLKRNYLIKERMCHNEKMPIL